MIGLVDLEHTSIGREAYKMKLTDALNILMDHALGDVDNIFNSGRSSTRQEIKLVQSMLRVNRYIRSNPSNRKRNLLGLKVLDTSYTAYKKVMGGSV
jgi:hypothetical protein